MQTPKMQLAKTIRAKHKVINRNLGAKQQK